MMLINHFKYPNKIDKKNLLDRAKSGFVLLTSFSFESKSTPREFVVPAGVSASSCYLRRLGLSVSFFLVVPFC